MDKVIVHVCGTKRALSERIGEIMGGRVLKLKCDKLIEECQAKGLAQGRAEGELSTYARLVSDGVVPIQLAAKNLNLSVPVLKEKVQSLLGITL